MPIDKSEWKIVVIYRDIIRRIARIITVVTTTTQNTCCTHSGTAIPNLRRAIYTRVIVAAIVTIAIATSPKFHSFMFTASGVIITNQLLLEEQELKIAILIPSNF